MTRVLIPIRASFLWRVHGILSHLSPLVFVYLFFSLSPSILHSSSALSTQPDWSSIVYSLLCLHLHFLLSFPPPFSSPFFLSSPPPSPFVLWSVYYHIGKIWPRSVWPAHIWQVKKEQPCWAWTHTHTGSAHSASILPWEVYHFQPESFRFNVLLFYSQLFFTQSSE